jgi:hypothetical protein
MATIALTENPGRLAKIGKLIESLAGQSGTNGNITITIDNTAWTVSGTPAGSDTTITLRG